MAKIVSNKDVLSVRGKDEKLEYTKLLRAWAKLNKTNQFDMAITLIATFYRSFNVQESFIREKGLTNEFVDFFMSLEADYDRMFMKLFDFRDCISNKVLPRFGE